MKLRPLILLFPLLLATTSAFAQIDAACKPVIAAGKAKAAAPAFHDRKNLAGTTIEAIKIGDTLYGNDGRGWKLLSHSASATMAGFDQQVASGAIRLSNCKKLGRESVDGRSTTVYEYTVSLQGMPAETSKIWVGDDGLPYREGDEGVDGHVTYTDVTAPVVKSKKK